MAQAPVGTREGEIESVGLIPYQYAGVGKTPAHIMHARMTELAGWTAQAQLLQQVTERAQRATQASGAAIALAVHGEFVCRASLGATAPEPGTRLDAQSGLSGECIRRSAVVLCDDADRDPRANAAACNQLGIRALLAVPIKAGSKVVGVLEVFSSRPNAFSRAHATCLMELAALVAQNQHQEISSGDNSLNTYQAVERAAAIGSLSRPRARLARNVMLATVVSASLVLLLYLTLRSSPATPIPEQTDTSTHLAAPASPESVEQVVFTSPPAPGSVTRPAKLLPRNFAPENQPINSSEVIIAAADRGHGTRALPTEKDLSDFDSPPNSQAILGGIPVPGESHTAVQQILRLPMSAVTGPPPPPVSTGVSGPALVHKVLPEYPQMARAQHMEGAVVLDAVIGKDGGVRDVRAISGNGLLARAAIKAVRYWRYNPSELNGEPLETTTRITLNFTLGH